MEIVPKAALLLLLLLRPKPKKYPMVEEATKKRGNCSIFAFFQLFSFLSLHSVRKITSFSEKDSFFLSFFQFSFLLSQTQFFRRQKDKFFFFFFPPFFALHIACFILFLVRCSYSFLNGLDVIYFTSSPIVIALFKGFYYNLATMFFVVLYFIVGYFLLVFSISAQISLQFY